MEIIFYTSRGLCPYISSHSFSSVQLSLVHFYRLRHILPSTSLPTYTNNTASTTWLILKDIKNPRSIKGGKRFDKIIASIPENTEISIDDYLAFVRNSKTSYFISFSEESTLKTGDKRGERSAKNAVEGLELCLASKLPNIIANVQGGKDLGSRKWCLGVMVNSEADGIYYGGLGIEDNGLELRNLLKSTCEVLKTYKKISVLSGAGRPLDIIFAATLGFSHFESIWPFKLANEGKALNFSFKNWTFSPIPEDSEYTEEVLNLTEPQYRYQKGPILEGCQCSTCQKHHRGYIFHLFQMEEMTAHTLVAIHNTWVYQEMISFLKDLKENGRIDSAYSGFVVNCCVQAS